MGVKIIVDSTADLTPEIKEQVFVVPLTVHFGSEEYLDGITITHREFYEKLIESDVLPTTSQPTPASFSDAIKSAVDEGDEAIILTISSLLSGTYQSAMLAAEDFKGKVFVADTKSASIGSGILVEMAVELRNRGMSAKEIFERIEKEKENMCVIALVGTLEYLKRGGRLSKTAAFAGEILNIKPVISIKEGAICVLGKARGSKQANNLLIKQIEEAGGIDFSKPLLLGYTGLSDLTLKKYIDDSSFIWHNNVDNLNITPIGSVIGTHAGPGAIALAFFKGKSLN